MSGAEDDGDGGPGQREVAVRLFATEFDDADLSYSESDEERAPNYVITPTGARVNRVFVVGVLTEVEPVSDDVLRARVVDPTGAFVCYAGQYQPDERAFLERAEPPTFVALTGKARTFQPEDSDVVYSSVRPESVNEVDADTRDRWTVTAAEQTIERVRTALGALDVDARGDALAAALRESGVPESHAAGLPLALDHYGTRQAYLYDLYDAAVEALELVAGDRDEVTAPARRPDDDTPVERTDVDVPTFEAPPVRQVEPADAVEGAAGTTEQSDDESGEPETDEPDVTDAGEVGTGADDAPETSGAVDVETEDSEAIDRETGEPQVGDQEAGESDVAAATDAVDVEDEPADSDPEEPGEFDLDEDEREAIESEYGTEFQSGTEVDEPGEADIDAPSEPPTAAEESAAEAEETAAEAGTTTDAESEEGPAATDDEPPAESGPVDTAAGGAGADETDSVSDESETSAEPTDEADADEEPSDADLENVALEVMAELSDGDGADRDEVVATVADRTGADESAVEDAIQEALMDGRCYEPADDRLQPI